MQKKSTIILFFALQKTAVCQLCKEEDPPDDSECSEIAWIQCDECDLWFHQQCTSSNLGPIHEIDDIFWKCMFCHSL